MLILPKPLKEQRAPQAMSVVHVHARGFALASV